MATIAEENIIISFQVETDGINVANKSVAALNQTAEKLNKVKIDFVDSKTIANKLLGVENAVKRIDDAVKKASDGDFTALENEFKDISAAAGLTAKEVEHIYTNTQDVVKELAQKLPNAGKGLGIIAEDAEQMTKQFTSAKQELRELTKQITSGQLDGDELVAARARAAQLTDEIGDVREQIRNMASDTRGLDTLIEGTRAVTAGFAIAEGAAALFGDENEDVQKALIKLNAIMAIQNGLQEAHALLLQNSNLRMRAAAITQGLYTAVVGTSTGALKLFRIALATTGIGLLVLLLGALVANWDKVKKSISENAQALFDFGKKVTVLVPPLNVLVKAAEYVYNNFDKIKTAIFGIDDAIGAFFTSVGGIAGALLEGDFSKAKELYNNVGRETAEAFYKGQKDYIAEQRLAGLADNLEKQNKLLGRQVELQNAAGRDSYNAQRKILINELNILRLRNADKEDILDKENEIEVLRLERIKDNAEKARKAREDAEKKAAEARKKALEDEIAATERAFVLRENEAKRTIKDAEELADVLKRIDLEKGLAVARVKLKFAVEGSLDEAELEGVVLDIERQLAALNVDRAVLDIPVIPRINIDKLDVPKEGLERIKEIRRNLFAGLLSDEEATRLIDEEVKKLSDILDAELQKVDIKGAQNILAALNNGGDVDTAKYEAETERLRANSENIKAQMQLLLDSGTGTAKEFNDLQLDLLNNEIALKERSLELDKQRQEENKKAALELIANAKAVTDELLNEAIRRKDNEIRIQEERVNGLLSTIDKGNTEQLQLEEERLAKLREEKEKYVRAQRRIAAIEIAINTAVAASNSITAITAAFKEGNLFKGIATSLALAAQIAAAVIAVRNAFSDLPSFRHGTERTGSGNVDAYGGYHAILHPNERVLTAEQNAPLLRYGIKNQDVPRLALMGLKNSRPTQLDTTKVEKALKEQNEQLRQIKEVLQNSGVDLSITDEGILKMTNRAQERINKTKKFRR